MHYLNMNELLEAAQDSKLPGVDVYIGVAEDLAQRLGVALAAHLKVEVQVDAKFEPGFGGLCVGFGPPDDQPDMHVPFYLADHDRDSDWAVENGIAPDPQVTPMVTLRFRAQALVGKSIVDAIHGRTDDTWQITAEEFLRKYPTEAEWDEEHEARDMARNDVRAPQWVQDWSGPFEVEIADATSPWEEPE